MHSINNALFIGKVLHEVDHVNSTNTYASELMAKSRPIEGTAIIAYYQSKGKGQFGNDWESEAGKNMTLSIILYPDFINPTDQFIINQAISIGVREFVKDVLKTDILIKWPNDIYHEDRKLGGILMENTISGNKLTSAIIGIGININQIKFYSGISNPTSFKLIGNEDYDVKQLAKQLFNYIEHRYLQLKRGEVEKIRNEYLKSMYKFQIESYFADKDKQLFKGRIIGIKPTGELQVEVAGNVKSFAFKEIVYV